MAACYFDMLFIFVYSGWEGTANDSRVFLDALKPTNNFPHPQGGKTSDDVYECYSFFKKVAYDIYECYFFFLQINFILLILVILICLDILLLIVVKDIICGIIVDKDDHEEDMNFLITGTLLCEI